MATPLYICTTTVANVQQPDADDDQMRSVHNQYLAVKRQRDARRKVWRIDTHCHRRSLLAPFKQALQDLPVTVLLDLVSNLKRRAAQVADAETTEYMVCA